MKIRYYDCVMKGGCPQDVLIERPFDFDPNAYTDAMQAAIGFYAALLKFINDAKPEDSWFGQDPATELSFCVPGTHDMLDDPTAWGVIWEAGPYRWSFCSENEPTAYRMGWGDWPWVRTFADRVAA
ncbi:MULTISPECIES: hypothetical protein [unclassified Ruegeria]|uniref:hypothetical protein n=1 Tax=unclassified Ruegeria TaxID=2625375 RepID=UPI0014894FB2|nr:MULTISPECIES: hypothetical protein [unclassified Ruegeria]NOD62185.1 hypothetical protein [Ruegeria sp. HKCCD6109]